MSDNKNSEISHADGAHHAHVRQRIHQKYEAFPHPEKLRNFLDRAIYPIGLAGPIFTIPQLFAIWTTQQAEGLSLITWSAWSLLAVFWILYGVLHREKPIIVAQSGFLIVNVGVVIGIVLYG